MDMQTGKLTYRSLAFICTKVIFSCIVNLNKSQLILAYPCLYDLQEIRMACAQRVEASNILDTLITLLYTAQKWMAQMKLTKTPKYEPFLPKLLLIFHYLNLNYVISINACKCIHSILGPMALNLALMITFPLTVTSIETLICLAVE